MKTKKRMSVYLKSIAIVGGVLFFACTQDEEIASNKYKYSDFVTFNFEQANEWKPDVISGDEVSQSRSTGVLMDCNEGESPLGEIYMYMMEEDCPSMVDTTSVVSRAGENKSTTPDISIFAYQVVGSTADGANQPSLDPTKEGCSLFMNTSESAYKDDQIKYWPGAGSWLYFFAYQPSGLQNIDGLTYDANNSPYQFTYEVPNDVSKQVSDLVTGSSVHPGNFNNEVSMSLSHILSKIQVKAGTINSGVVESISFKNIAQKATYSFITNSWILATQEGGEAVLTDYTQNTTDKENGLVKDEENIYGKPFYLLPQDLTKAQIEIKVRVKHLEHYDDKKFNRDDEVYTLTKDLKEFTKEWKQNKQYTYILTTPQQVDVEISDRVVRNSGGEAVKKDVVIKNTGLSPAYIRAAITGNWVQFNQEPDYDNQNYQEITQGKTIVGKWDRDNTDTGIFAWGTETGGKHPLVAPNTPNISVPANSWIECSDGYFYYTHVLEPGAELRLENGNALFESYTLKKNTAPINGAVLELMISIQSVHPYDIGIIWKPEIVSVINNANRDNDVEL